MKLVGCLGAAGLAVSLCAAPAAVLADDLALVIGNGNYDGQRNIRGIRDGVSKMVPVYRNQGYTVIEGYDLDSEEFRLILDQFASKLADADRVIVHYSGYTLHSTEATWLAPVDIDQGSILSAAFGAPTVELIFDMLATKPGRAAVFLGTFDSGNVAGDLLAPGLGPVDPPQGVLLLSGRPADVIKTVETSILSEGVTVAEAIAGASGNVRVTGFVSPDAGFGRRDAAPVEELSDFERERRAWARVQADSSAENLEAYLRAFPNGAFAAIARKRLEEMKKPKTDPDIAAEQSLRLTRDARRGIQENLVVLGYDTRGVDGIFGRGTRAAIRSWQNDQNLRASGYLTRTQLRLLEVQATKRADEIAAEAERKRLEEERADIAFWQATGADGTAEGLRKYLETYPDGVYSQEASEALRQIEAEERASAQAADTAAWDRAKAVNTVGSYRAYIRAHPRGAFVGNARNRISRLGRGLSEEQKAAYERAENQLGLTLLTRAMIERRLKAHNLDPGRVDGIFDDATRRAIRRFQRTRGLEVTGYVNGATMRQLIIASR
ncbi:MAG: peptidoglycan-binding protein [Paracoccaceae bacterium]